MLPVAPDVVDLTIRALLGQPAVTALVGTRVYDRVAGSVYPLLVVGVVDFAPTAEPRRTVTLVQVDCWGRGGDPAQATQASLLARTVAAVAPDLRGAWPPAAGYIVAAYLDRMLPQPDTTTGRARWLVQLEVTTATMEEQ